MLTVVAAVVGTVAADHRVAEAHDARVLGCGRAQVVVFGNSTDWSAGDTADSAERAWPAVLERTLLTGGRIRDLHVTNESHPGMTSVVRNIWGKPPYNRAITYIPEVFRKSSKEQRARTLVIVAPSIIDLQLNDGDVDEVLEGMQEILEELEELGIGRTLVLPMNPISHKALALMVSPRVNHQARDLNRRMSKLGLLDHTYERSPIVGTNGIDGADLYYNDFVTHDEDGRPGPPDYTHIDPGGHRRIAEVLAPVVRSALPEVCSFESVDSR